MTKVKKYIFISMTIGLLLLAAVGCNFNTIKGNKPIGNKTQDPSTTTDPDQDPTPEPTAEPTPEPTARPTAEPTWDELVKGSAVYARVNKDLKVYSYASTASAVLGNIEAGSTVLLIGQSSKLSMASIRYNGEKGYVSYDGLSIPEDPPTNTNRLSREQLEEYANEVGEFESDTEYFLWTDIDRQLTYIYKGKTKDWSLKYVWDCATGLNMSPTTRGNYKIQERGNWFYTERLNSGFYWWTRFNGGYLYHSYSYTRDGELYDDALGKRSSAGCVRLDTNHAKWIYDNIPQGTGVWVN
ncbi:MAG TPA: L,D-transpeptidase family protein [Bacillota bacterium]|nr:L,D-transpeptidase family protein [Bacillota bacterium]